MADNATIDGVGARNNQAGAGGNEGQSWHIPGPLPGFLNVRIADFYKNRELQNLTKLITIRPKDRLVFRGTGLKLYSRARILDYASHAVLTPAGMLNENYGNDASIVLVVPDLRDFIGAVQLEFISDVDRRLSRRVSNEFELDLKEEVAPDKAQAKGTPAGSAAAQSSLVDFDNLAQVATLPVEGFAQGFRAGGQAAPAPAAGKPAASPPTARSRPGGGGGGEPGEGVVNETSAVMSETAAQAAELVGEYLDKNPGIIVDSAARGRILGALGGGNIANLSAEDLQTLQTSVNAGSQELQSLQAERLSSVGLNAQSQAQLTGALQMVGRQAGEASARISVGVTAGGSAGGTVAVQGQVAAARPASGLVRIAGSTSGSISLSANAGGLSLGQSREVVGELISSQPGAMPAAQDRQAALEFLASGNINGLSGGQRQALQAAIQTQISGGQASPRQQAALQNVGNLLARVNDQTNQTLRQNREQVGEYLDKNPAAMPAAADRQAVLGALASGNLENLSPQQRASFRRFLDAQLAGPAQGSLPLLSAMQNLRLALDGQMPQAEIQEAPPLSPGSAAQQPGAALAAAPGLAAEGLLPQTSAPTPSRKSAPPNKAGEEILNRLRKSEKPLSAVVAPRGSVAGQEESGTSTVAGQQLDRGLNQPGAERAAETTQPPAPDESSPASPAASAAPPSETAVPGGGAGGEPKAPPAVQPPAEPGAGGALAGQPAQPPPPGGPVPPSGQAAPPDENTPAAPAIPPAAAAASSAAAQGAEAAAGLVTSKAWYWGFTSAVATWFSGLDFMVGAIVMVSYWIFGYRKNKKLFPLKRWQKAVTILAILAPPIYWIVGAALVIYIGCNYPMPANSVTGHKGSVIGLLYPKACDALDSVISANVQNGNTGFLSRLNAPALSPNGACAPATSGIASVASLQSSCFGTNAPYASIIAQHESGGNPAIGSSADICRDAGGNYVPYHGAYAGLAPQKNGQPVLSVSWGLFQINLTAHKMTLPDGTVLDCPSAAGPMYTAQQHQCSIKNAALFDRCVGAAIDSQTTINNACLMSNNGANWGPWQADIVACSLNVN
ncbi:MAG: hypothetical protein KGJ93_00365 [Patescibacteria group bacterium]|nr:hypothetical protein [Patescibacteria group bacterium]